MADLMDDIVATAQNFVQNMQQYYENPLDYSFESLAEVDEMLDGLGKRREEFREEGFFDLYSMTGCYVFEVARRNFGGEYFWIEEEQQPILVAGQPDFSVSIRAWEKVKERMVNGPADNIAFYIAGYQEHIEKGKKQKGYHVTIV